MTWDFETEPAFQAKLDWADRFVREEVEPLELKGKSEPVPAYRLVGVRQFTERARRLDAPMVGRDAELETLRSALRCSTDDGRCRLVTVIGEAGVGKSRLIDEFIRSVEGEASVLRGRCLPYGEGITFWPLAEAVRHAADIAERDSMETAQQKLAALAGPGRRRASDQAVWTPPQATATRPALTTVATAPIPLAHPYNLPAPAPPMTPRTTRRQMLSTELSESLRRNLLWERQVSKVNMLGGARRTGLLSQGLRPLTAVNANANTSASSGANAPQHQQQQVVRGEAAADDREERRRAAVARNRSWADDYHYSGW